MKVGETYTKVSSLTITSFDEETKVVKGINDVGAEVIMLESQVEELYTLKENY